MKMFTLNWEYAPLRDKHTSADAYNVLALKNKSSCQFEIFKVKGKY